MVCAADAPAAAAAERVLDWRGLTVVPGLIDAHIHITTRGAGKLHEEMEEDVERALEIGRANLANAVSWGVTTVRDAGSWNGPVLALRDEAARGAFVGPRVLPAGAPLTTTRGHLYWFGGEANGPAAVRKFVARQSERGMTHVKVMATGGWATPGSDPRLPQFSVAELAAAAPRVALTEVGPAYSPDGDWDPAVVTRTLREQGLEVDVGLEADVHGERRDQPLDARDERAGAQEVVQEDDAPAGPAHPAHLARDGRGLGHHADQVRRVDDVERGVGELQLGGVHLQQADVGAVAARLPRAGLLEHRRRQVDAHDIEVGGELGQFVYLYGPGLWNVDIALAKRHQADLQEAIHTITKDRLRFKRLVLGGERYPSADG